MTGCSSPRSGKPRDYVDRPELSIRDEPECIGPAILNSYADVNRRIWTQQHVLDVAEAQERRPQLSPVHRLEDVRRRAKDAHVDLSHEIHLVQLAVDKARFRAQPVCSSALNAARRAWRRSLTECRYVRTQPRRYV